MRTLPQTFTGTETPRLPSGASISVFIVVRASPAALCAGGSPPYIAVSTRVLLLLGQRRHFRVETAPVLLRLTLVLAQMHHMLRAVPASVLIPCAVHAHDTPRGACSLFARFASCATARRAQSILHSAHSARNARRSSAIRFRSRLNVCCPLTRAASAGRECRHPRRVASTSPQRTTDRPAQPPRGAGIPCH